MVNILFFGRLKEQLQCGQVQLQPEHALSVEELKLQLVGLYPAWQQLLMDDQLLVAVDQTMATATSQVGTTAEVAFFPPVTGG
ncbi:MAG: MoaD/ThiS family protein [Gammaproteobacteria bacterium]|jgi:molybdopterin synthase sulfur carrier subunit|nr:MoaD/ThiS family protein [Gammaproteobacteria bacterium]